MPDHVPPLSIASARTLFPGAEKGPYFDTAARGLLYSGARTAIDAILDAQEDGTLDKKRAFDTIESTRSLFAALIRCHADEVAYTRNITDGIAAFAASLPWKPGDAVVVCDTLEHPANLFPWYGLRDRFGVTVRTVAQQDGMIPLDRLIGAIDERTRAVSVSTVSFAPGFRFPVADLGRHCRARGVLLAVDAAQSIGIVDTDVEAWQVDALSASGQKGLMSLYGIGFLYVRRAVAEGLAPVYVSRFGVDVGDGHEAESGDLAAYRLAPGARRFDVGNYNYTAAAAAGASIRLLLDLGPRQVEEHVMALAHRFAVRMTEIGLPVFGGVSNAHASHIVTVGKALGSAHDSTGDADMAGLYDHLTANGVRLGVRRDLLRFSFHIYNNDADIDRVVDLCQAWMRR
ncbi:MAG TPA: aminotransferase class V-fold PLP-dependent enzyme [Rhodopila sp.]|uniref:aminotransferase class V-fold PLP-dependent enzyme n=1 Tax=Rhodopila sp. TaxID=2480087 RepID=UPI002CF164B6|nr:aminotransferase class V-fold PLP-dependent enzyme [Rhodopila sp.]HVY14953.1 aminotransferase class V-fold PLP-dependent enzyme [Rhodopila sp.]